MKYKNSFFRIEIKDNGTYLSLFPAMADGKLLDVQEIMDFLDSKKFDSYSIEKIKLALKQLGDKPVRVKISDEQMPSFAESAVVKTTPDKMIAFMRFYPPSTGGAMMTKKEIMADLELAQIKFGISEKAIDLFLANRQYCANILIAKGKKPIPAKDTEIEYFFETRPLSKPKMLADGSVDFHELSLFTSVAAGETLAKLTPHVDGVNGMTVLGKEISTTKPKVKKFKYGRNISLSEDGLMLISDVNGDVSLTGGTVFVSDTYKVAADIDASTGDIDYEGNIHIPGTVKTGFVVKAKGDIQVDGVVEGATLIAGGDIIIKRGVQGMGKGKLVSGGDISAQFFESANVDAQGDVNAGSILHSNVKSGGKVVVSGKKGFIVGGEIICENYVEVNTVGNKMETQTVIKVGVKPELLDELKAIMSEVTELNERYEEASSYLNVYREKIKKGVKLTPENLKKVKEYTSTLEEIEGERGPKTERMREIREQVDLGKKGSVKVIGSSYVGVTIFIASRIMSLKDKLTHCWYKIVDGDIQATPF